MQEFKKPLYVPQKPLDIRGLSALLGISVATLNRRKAEGKLPHHRIGARIVYTSKDIENFLASFAVPISNAGEVK